MHKQGSRRSAFVVKVRDRSRLKAFRLEACVFVVSSLAAFAFHRAGCTTLAILGAVIAAISAGIVPPQWFGWHERTRRAIVAKWREKRKWGFHSRDRDVPWVAHIEGPLILCEECARDKFFYSEWLIIHDGHIIVNPGYSEIDELTGDVTYDHAARRTYAWDGCTPKRSWLWVALLGIPDWWQRKFVIVTVSHQGIVKQEHVFWPITHYASVVHDALYQYLHHIPIEPEEVDRLFHVMLKRSGMSPVLAYLYYSAVRRCGGKDAKNARQEITSWPRVFSPLLNALSNTENGSQGPSTITEPAKSPPS
jgi:hypothetical protein